MSKNSLVNNFIILWILLQVIIIEVNCQMAPIKPSVSFDHTATFIDNKLYILGGLNIKENYVGKEFFYLDVSVPFAPFNTQNLLWNDLTNINMLPSHSSATSVANNDTIFLYGGFRPDKTMALVYTFNTRTSSWSIPKIAGVVAIAQVVLKGILAPNEKLYLFGGYSSGKAVNDMTILDTVNLNWGKGSLVNAPTPRGSYGAALLPNNKIIYMGGDDDTTLSYDPKTLLIHENRLTVTLNEVYIYDIINDSWNTEKTTGKIPSNRGSFSAVLGLDGQKVIIYGGYFNDPGYLDNSLYVLDLTNFNWYIPKTSGNIPKPRAMHQANIIGKYMVISFGHGYDKSVESDILLLDISNNEEYIWTTIFDPPKPNVIIPSSSSNSSLPSSSSTTSLPSSSLPSITTSPSPYLSLPSSSQTSIGTIVGFLVSGIFLLVGSFFIYKWNKNKKKQKTNHGKDNFGQEEIEIPIEKVNNNEQEIIQVPLNEKTINHEPTIIPVPVINENIDYHGREIMEISKNENTINNEQIIIPVPVINENNDYHGQEIMVISKNENTINHEPTIIPVPVINENNDYHEREIMETPNNENTINHEPTIISASIINENNDYHEREITETPNNENTINHEPTIIPASVINEDDYHEQEIMETPNNKNTINHEPTIIPASVINEDYHEQEIITPNNENTINHEPTIIPASVINKNDDHHGREIMETSKNENTTNHEPILIPTLVINEDNGYHEKEISLTYENGNTTNHEPVLIPTNGQTLEYESTTNHEPRIPTSALVTSNHNQQEVISTSNHDRLLLQLFKDEMLQAVKQEISQNLKNEIIQAVRGENLNNNNITKNNEKQD
ncbi:galactose oxidase [Rhizophagus irregularis]|uniref:Galactose oxidase n=1 Tax=Rhizophagus irregularis TaxID=588596 RepID=A0A2N0PEY9_9GLOM|nr:galactose oxidase [Rhizophagus irregularis]